MSKSIAHQLYMDFLLRTLMMGVWPSDPEGITWPVNQMTHDPYDLNSLVPQAAFYYNSILFMGTCVKANSIIC